MVVVAPRWTRRAQPCGQGASSVNILYRRTRAEMPAQSDEVRAALEEGIHLHELTAPVEVLDAKGRITTPRCQRMVLGEPDERGRRRPVPMPGSAFDIPTSQVIVAIEEAPDPSFLPEGSSIQVAAWTMRSSSSSSMITFCSFVTFF